MYRLPTTLLFLAMALNFSIGQVANLPVREWKEKLSIKEDLGWEIWEKVFNEIQFLDTAYRCEVLALLHDKTQKQNTRYQIRLAITTKHLNFSPGWNCAENISGLEQLQIALRQAYELGDDLLIAQINYFMALASLYEGKTSLSVTHYRMAKEVMEKAGLENFRYYSNTLYGLGDMLYSAKDYRGSVNMFKLALQYRGQKKFDLPDTLDAHWKMRSWHTLGLCYKEMGLYDSAFYALNQALVRSDHPFRKAMILGDRGDVFFKQGRYDSAEALLKLDYQESVAWRDYTHTSFTLQSLAAITNLNGHHHQALEMLNEAKRLDQKAPSYSNQAALYKTYAQVYRDLGNADSAYYYMEQSKSLDEIANREAAHSQVEMARMYQDNQKHVYAIISLQKDKNKILLIRNFSIALILILALAGYLLINRLQIRAKMKHREAAIAMERAEAEALKAREQLIFFTESLQEKTQLIENLQSASKALQEEHFGQIEELSRYTILTDEDWDRFRVLFTKVYPGFFVELKERIPDITVGEQRMAALVKLRISTKDSAAMLGVSVNSIYKTRQRLRTRMGLEQDADLENYFLQD